jgi:hypothetical protein
MGFYDNFSGGLIGGGKQNEYSLPGIKAISDSSLDIVRGSIDLHLDAANPSSYPGTGTTWTDLSGNARNGTLTNGPTFTSDLNGSGGYITLDGTNDYISLGANFNYTTQSFSIGCWVYFLSFDHASAQYINLFWKGNFGVNGYYAEINPVNGSMNFYTNQSLNAAQQSAAIYQPNPSSFPNRGFMPGEWYNFYFVRNGTSVRIYINGIDRTSTVGTHTNPLSTSNNFEIGRYNSASHFPNMRLASFIIYQKALTAAEVLQNFNASRKRFGL